ncbi:MAG: SUMF1/EgtB/PvdO family nonheme iron enzyme [Treponema sp.]|nr:SUMF1/EgtB/PvdO family nonheme iron enzyme [Candidatus Treponema caballi]
MDYGDHSWGEDVVVREPNHFSGGKTEKTCLICGGVHATWTPRIEDHSFSTVWNYDETSHWHKCDCGEKADVSTHIWDDGYVITSPSCVREGVVRFYCTVCGVRKDEIVPRQEEHHFVLNYNDTSHFFECFGGCGEKRGEEPHNLVVCSERAPSCLSPGEKVCECTVCGWIQETVIPKKRHTWDNGIVKTQPTHTANGSMEYSCTVCGTISRSSIPAIGHTFETEYSSDEKTHWHVCSCGAKSSEEKHTWGNGIVITQPTHATKGSKKYCCTVCGREEIWSTPAIGHTFETEYSFNETTHWHACSCGAKYDEFKHFFEVVENVLPSCVTPGKLTERCRFCGYEKTTIRPVVSHVFSWMKSDFNVHYHVCSECGTSANDEEPHTWEACESYCGKYKCTICGREKQESIPDEEHLCSDEWSSADTFHYKRCKICTSMIYSDVHTWELSYVIPATMDTPGLTGFHCSVCNREKEVSFDSFSQAGLKYVQGETLTQDAGTLSRGTVIPSLYACDHEVTYREWFYYMDGEVYQLDSYGDWTPIHPVRNITPREVLVYCNRRSINEGLTPCYKIYGSTNPDDWGEIPTSAKSENWEAWKAAECDFSANGYRLPTEEEWEYLARGGKGYFYSGSDTIDDVAWYSGNADGCTHVVKTLAPNDYGLYDMAGNVAEWCWKENTATFPARGGHFGAQDTVIYTCLRNSESGKRNITGFRVVRTAE